MFYRPVVGNKAPIIESEYRQLVQSMNEIKSIDRDDIEYFWKKINKICSGSGEPLFNNVCRFVFDILCLPHSSAEVERVFSMVNIIKTKLRNRLHVKTVEAVLLSKDLLKASIVMVIAMNMMHQKM